VKISKSDRELVSLVQEERDEEAFHGLYARHNYKVSMQVARSVSGYGLNRETIEDIIQDIWLKVWRSIDRFRGDSSFRTWLLAIARNTARDYIKRKFRSPITLVDTSTSDGETPEERDNEVQALLEDISIAPDAGQMASSREFAEILADAMVAALTDQQYDVYHLKLLNWKNVEIATEIGTSPNVVNVQHTKAKKLIKTMLSERFGYSEEEIESDIRKVQRNCLEYLSILLISRGPEKRGASK